MYVKFVFLWLQLDEWVLCRIYKKNSSAQKSMTTSVVSSKEHSNNGSSSSSSSHLDDVMDTLPEIDDRFFALPRTNSLKTMQHEEKPNFNNLGSGSFDWASLAGLNSVQELVPSGQTQGVVSYANCNANDVYVPSIPPLCHADTSREKMGNSVEEEVQSGVRTQRVGNSMFFQQNSGVLTQNFSNSLDPYGFRYSTQPGCGFGFRQ